MYVIVAFFNEARTDFLVVGPYASIEAAETGLLRERARHSNAGVVDINYHFVLNPQPPIRTRQHG